MIFTTAIDRGVLLRRLVVMATCLAVPLLAPRAAWANPRPLPFTYPWETLGEGALEIEQYVDMTPVRAREGEASQVVEPHDNGGPDLPEYCQVAIIISESLP